MPEPNKTLAGPGDSSLPVAEAERQLAQLCRPAAASSGLAVAVAQLAAAAVMTGAGAGLWLFAQPSTGARMAAAVCALVVAARILAPAALARRAARRAGGEPGWVAAAAVHRASLPGRVPAATLAAVDRYLPVPGRGHQPVHLYVGPCAGAGKHTRACFSVGVLAQRRLLLVGEHVAMTPALVAASLAHEAGHTRGWTWRVLVQLHHMRQAGWGWAVAGLTGARWGWLGVLVAAVVFQAGSLLLVWAVEIMCDRAAVREVGPASYREALRALSVMSGEFKRERPRSRSGKLIRLGLFWLAGPSHPPLALRRALIRG